MQRLAVDAFLICYLLFIFINKISCACDLVEFGTKLRCDKFSVPENLEDSIEALEVLATDQPTLTSEDLKFSKIRSLKISGSLKNLEATTFQNIPQLEELSLTQNEIEKIPNNLFVSFQVLEKLDLSHNELGSPDYETYNYLEKLLSLDVSYNNIQNITLGLFFRQTKLTTLNMSHNLIRELKLGALDPLVNLLHLDISYNFITTIPYGIFDKPNKIAELVLDGNNLKEIPLGLFNALERSLLTLRLSNSRIRKFPLGAIDGIPWIQNLDVSRNPLVSIELGMLDRAKDFRTLNMSRCGLTSFPSGIFDRSPGFHTLDLSYNKLTEFYVQIFKKANREVTNINLSHNELTFLDKDIFTLTTLKFLDISYNKIEEIQLGLLALSTIEEVHGQNNKILYLDPKTFNGSTSLRYLDFSHNRLVYINKNFFNGLVQLKQFNIGGNPWDCKCLNELLNYLGRNGIAYSKGNYFDGKKPVCVANGYESCNEIQKELLPSYSKFTSRFNK